VYSCPLSPPSSLCIRPHLSSYHANCLPACIFSFTNTLCPSSLPHIRDISCIDPTSLSIPCYPHRQAITPRNYSFSSFSPRNSHLAAINTRCYHSDLYAFSYHPSLYNTSPLPFPSIISTASCCNLLPNPSLLHIILLQIITLFP
jgi:hypothetical protein